MFFFNLLKGIPECILGCKVLTLPSNISSNPVNSEISIHLKPSFFIDLYVPPELIIFILFFFKI